MNAGQAGGITTPIFPTAQHWQHTKLTYNCQCACDTASRRHKICTKIMSAWTTMLRTSTLAAALYKRAIKSNTLDRIFCIDTAKDYHNLNAEISQHSAKHKFIE